MLRRSRLALACIAIALAVPAAAQTTLRVVKHSDLKIVDPIWTTAYITRDHGYMIYDTLFATDANGQVKPQMIDKYDLSADKLTWTMTLRDGLLWHDGTPVTAEDCVASIRRWGAKDAMGQKMMSFVKDMPVVDAKTFRIVLNAPTGLVLTALGKPSSNVPFMMPKRVAATDPNTQISDYTGSGPFVFRKDEWKPGDRSVYVKWDKYKPRSEPVSGLAGGKVAKVDRIEWRQLADQQTAVNALIAGEIDFIEQPSHDLLPVLRKDSNIKLVDWNPLGNQYAFRFNTTAKPFDNVKVRQAINMAIDRDSILKEVYQGAGQKAKNLIPPTIWSYNDAIKDYEYNPEKAKEMLKAAGVENLQSDLWWMPVQRPYNPNAKRMAEMMQADLAKVGITVELKSYEWGEYRKRMQQGEHQMGLLGWTGDNGDPDNFFFLLGCTGAREGGQNISKWCDKSFEDRLQQAKKLSEKADRTKLYEEMQVISKEEAPIVTIAHSTVFEPVSKKVSDYKVSPLGRHDFYGVDIAE